ncbi:MAG: hypothetical protein RL021_1590 [Bacteroidota bacterium]|jgi:hypothetical protein
MNQFVKVTLALLLAVGAVQARENVGTHRNSAPRNNRMFAACQPSKSKTELDINNVRCPIFINGDMWWDLVGNAEYEVPYGSGKHSLFAGAIWIGGKDTAGNLRVAAQTYRQSGSDFWPGPLSTVTAGITPDECSKYDRHWKVSKSEVKAFVDYYRANGTVDPNTPDAIKEWPAMGDPAKNQAMYLAPFNDVDSDGVYDWQNGDYPGFNLSTTPQCGDVLYGDQTIWWVFNDDGNNAPHDETGSLFRIGVEIQAQAFAFATNDEINNMTFYRYKIINRSSQTLYDTYFGAWVDPDLGNYLDDYVGCDVKRGFGYCYNGDADDDGSLGYGVNPPAVGVDFFEGPLADANDGVDNDRDSIVDEPGEQIIMSKFVYYNNDGSNIGNPNTAQQYYNYMRGIWKDGSPLVYGGNGYQTAGADSCEFMFPGDTDPNGWGTRGVPLSALFPWSESIPTPGGTPNPPDDRRFLQAAGSFRLLPGAVNYITTGVVWARSTSGGPLASVKLVRLADDKAQLLFNSCFKVVDGPDAPELTIRELDRELIFSIVNPSSSNNFREEYREQDLEAQAAGNGNSEFVFEGYKVYQVKDPSVSPTELTDADKARLIFQCDVRNGVAQIVNQYFQPELNALVSKEEVVGEDKGLRHTFRVSTDAFASGDPNLVNHQNYYFMAVAYAYNPDQAVFDPYVDGLGKPYLAGRRSATGGAINVYTAIPHISSVEAGGLVLNTTYGDGPSIQRISGIGNGYNLGSDRLTLDISQDQIDNVLFNASAPANVIDYPVYERAKGPVDIRVYDPVKVAPGDFELWLTDTSRANGRWILKKSGSNPVVDSSEKSLEFPYDQLFPNYGFYVSLNQVDGPGDYKAGGNGYIEGTKEYSNSDAPWLSGVTDLDNFPQWDWIRSGSGSSDDPAGFYEKTLNGTWAPFKLCSFDSTSDRLAPAPNYAGAGTAISKDSLSYVCGVDVVLTNDRSKWSRCVVFEMSANRGLTKGNQYKNLIRKQMSVDINGNETGVDSGYSWFPGYAINVETGERLNIAFGEESDTTRSSNNGKDMLFNPTSTMFDDDGRLIAGGRHVIYVFGNKRSLRYPASYDTVPNPAQPLLTYYGPAYDGCQWIHDRLWGLNVSATNQRIINQVWKDCMWVSPAMTATGQQVPDYTKAEPLASDVRVRLRVARPYRLFQGGSTDATHNYLPYYKFSTNDLTARVQQTEVAQEALKLINVVPNPYYAYSTYEQNQLDNRIKITNLPSKCTVSIYTTSGILVRRLKRDAGLDNTGGTIYPNLNLESSIDWDLKNTENVPVASGLYIIHVDAPGIGERTLKWFGVLRPIDLDTF